MRELDRCDFCAERADGVYEVLPPEVDAAERRLVLCADCRDTLSGVVEPLLDALEARDADAAASREPSVTVEPTASADTPTVEPTPDATSSDADVSADVDELEPETEADVGAGEADETDAASDGAGVAATPADSSAAEPADTDDAEQDDSEPNDAEPSDGESAVSTAANAARPTGYRRVVRLLRNRPAAMTRTDLAELAEGAYDLSAREVEAVVDVAIENGDLEETAEGLRAA
ncbi:hypothetical protein [Halarchaeum sp. P4]|uniref:hypothetical protein n=1 Tax=Halarchaeum sp. P4 TaxID=3421639 RepID=UPI003EC01F82